MSRASKIPQSSKTRQAMELFDRTPGLSAKRAAVMIGINPNALYEALNKREGRCRYCGQPFPPSHRTRGSGAKKGFATNERRLKQPPTRPPVRPKNDADSFGGLVQDLP